MRIVFLLITLCPFVFGQEVPELVTESSTTEKEEETTYIPNILSEPITISVNEREAVILPCQVDRLDDYVLMWQHAKPNSTSQTMLFANDLKTTKDKHYTINKADFTLHIKDIRARHGGTYTCRISTHAVPVELIHHVIVKTPPVIQTIPPDGTEVVKKGKMVAVGCSIISGNPKPTITWARKDGKPLDSGVATDNGKLVIDMATRHHAGTYMCTADNGVGQPVVKEVGLLVKHEPEIIVAHAKVNSDTGYSANLTCEVYAEPAATVGWIHADGSDIKASGNYVLKMHPPFYTLHIENMTNNDFGNYTCKANNALGQDMAMVEVSRRPEPAEIRNDRSNGYRTTSYALTWEVKSHKPVTDYLVKYRKAEDDTNEWMEIFIPAETQPGVTQTQTYEITGLEPGTTYEAMVLTKNEFDWSDPSEKFLFTTASETRSTQHPNEIPETPAQITSMDPTNSPADGGVSLKDQFRKAQLLGVMIPVVLSLFFL